MELEEKIQKINLKLRQALHDKNNIVIRVGGVHTEKLLCLTCILEYWDKISIVDKKPYGIIGNKVVKGTDEIQWDLVDAVIISSLTYQKDIEDELLTNSDFRGEVIRLYEEQDITQFFELQKDNDFLILEKEESWKAASSKSKSGYASEDILQYDYQEFIQHKKKPQKNKARHLYDVLFYMLKTVIQLRKEEINVLDFGGGFGTIFLDLKYYLKNLDIKCKWTIIDQEKVVERCLKEQDNIGASFMKGLDDIDAAVQFDFVLFGSCLQYIENYQDIIRKALTLNPYRIAILKTPVSDETFVTVQHVNRMGNYDCYTAHYACRIMKEEELISIFSDKYQLEDVEEDVFNNPDNRLEGQVIKWKDFFFEKK